MIRLFSHYVSPHLLRQMAFDFGILVVLQWLAVAMFAGEAYHGGVASMLGVSLAGATVLVGFMAGMYRRGPTFSLAMAWLQAAITFGLVVPLVVLAMSLIRGQLGQPTALILTLLAATGLVLALRVLALRGRPNPKGFHRVLIVGAGSSALPVAACVSETDRHASIVGYFPTAADGQRATPDGARVYEGMSLADAAKQSGATEIVVSVKERRGGAVAVDELLACRARGIVVSDMTSYFERTQGVIRLDNLHAGWLVFGDGFNQGWARTLIKRMFDIVAASTLLLLALPVMLTAMVLIKLDSRGEVLFRQERVGRNGKTFHVLKLRSMVENAEVPGQPQWAKKADTRVTRVGRVIRLMRIDELPQLINVLRGDMSLVGPRPERPEFVAQLTDEVAYYAIRHSVKPGLTGWAQVRYQYGGSVEGAKGKLEFDLYYVKNHTLFLDMLVLLKTVAVVLTGKGAR
jgi:sugar transferase (PEP-CTERM system associated)